MKKIYSAANLQDASIFRDLLEADGIPCEIRGDHLSNLRGTIPTPDSYPSIWVEDSDYEKAIEKIKEYTSQQAREEPWICKKCNEDNEGQFTICWNCGNER